jgi:hypothetical protein
MVATSLKAGTPSSTHRSSVSKQAANMGKVAFLEPLTVTVPFKGLPPRMTSFSMEEMFV